MSMTHTTPIFRRRDWWKWLRRLLSPRPGPSPHEAQRRLDSFVVSLEKLGWSAVVAMGTVTAAAFAGWFGSDDALDRYLASWFVLWFGVTTLVCLALTIIVTKGCSQGRPAPTKLQLRLKFLALTMVMIWLGWAVYSTFMGAWMVMSMAARQDFRPDLRPSDYAAAVRQLAEPTGAPFTAFWPLLGHPGKVDEKLLTQPLSNCLATSPGAPIRDGETVEGRLFPLASGDLVLAQMDGSTTSIHLFGIATRDGDATFATTEIAQMIESLDPGDHAGRDTVFRCVRPAFANGRWICKRQLASEGQASADLGLSLLRRGGAILDTQAVIGTPVQEDYLAGSFLAQSNGCGIWSRN